MKHRSAITGKAVSKDFAEKNKSTTVNEGKSKDTKRLDWLEENGPTIYRNGAWWILHLGIGSGGRAPSLRKVIDGQMELDT